MSDPLKPGVEIFVTDDQIGSLLDRIERLQVALSAYRALGPVAELATVDDVAFFGFAVDRFLDFHEDKVWDEVAGMMREFTSAWVEINKWADDRGHDGDCVSQPMACMRCQTDEWRRKAKDARDALRKAREGEK